MVKEQNLGDTHPPRRISRRRFIQLAAAGLLFAGCTPIRELATTPASKPASTPTSAPTAKPTAAPTDTPTTAPTAAPTAEPAPEPRRPDIIQIYPDVPSRVVHTHHAGVWDGADLNPGAIRQMLDASITQLTGLDDVGEAWAALFDPGDRIAIKVNTIKTSLFRTHVPLVMTVTECLQEIGVPAEQIVIFDRFSTELERAGYTINKDGDGVRCYGTDFNYVEGWKLMDQEIGLSDVLTSCNALINMPILKHNLTGGVTFAMKNNYGVFDRPQDFHPPHFDQAVAGLNALPAIQDHTRLIVGDAFKIARCSSTGWSTAVTGDSIFMSFDPVAHDAAGLQLLREAWEGAGNDPTAAIELALPWLENAAGLGLGTNDPENTELVEITMG